MDSNKVARAKKRRNKPAKSGGGIFNAIKKQEQGFEMALPDNWDSSRFTRVALTALRKNPKLQKCSKESVLGAFMLSAQLGLEPNSPLQEAYLIPYWNGKTKSLEAQFQIGYRGLLKLAMNSGMVRRIDYGVIRENDEYEYTKGFNPIFDHKPKVIGDRGDALAYYALAELKDGGEALVVKSREQVWKHALKYTKMQKNGKLTGAWKDDFDSMAIKTVLRELADKKIPKATTNEALRFAEAAMVDEKTAKMSEDQVGEMVEVGDLDGLDFDDDEFEDAEEVESDSEEPEQPKKAPQPDKEPKPQANKPEKPERYPESDEFDNWYDRAQCYVNWIEYLGGDAGDVIENRTGERTLDDSWHARRKSALLGELSEYYKELVKDSQEDLF